MNIEHYMQDKNIMAIKVGKRHALMYDDDPEDEIPQTQPSKKLSKQQESKLRDMIEDDQFLYSQVD